MAPCEVRRALVAPGAAAFRAEKGAVAGEPSLEARGRERLDAAFLRAMCRCRVVGPQEDGLR